MKNRKIIQISSCFADSCKYGPVAFLYALCNDGTLWVQHDNNEWKQIDSIPQDIINDYQDKVK
jgi:hypothetical protein